jgi:hypothetical protein
VAHQVLGLVFYEETHAWETDEYFCKCSFRHPGTELYCVERVQSELVRANSVSVGYWP